VLIGGLIGMNGTVVTGPTVEKQSYLVTIAPPPDAAIGQRVTGQDHNLAISPDGTRIAFVATNSMGLQQLWIRELNSLAPRPLAGTEGADSPFWSPDGRFLAFFADERLQKISSTGGVPIVLCQCSGSYGGGGTWNGDDVIVFSGGGSIHRISASGGQPELVVSRAPIMLEWPVFLPDGDHFLYRGPGNMTHVRSLNSGEEKVVGAGANAQYATGYLIFWRDGVLLAQSFDESNLTLVDEPLPLAESVPGGPGGGAFSVSPNGNLVYQTGSDNSSTALTWFDRDGQLLNTIGEAENYGDVQLSPDGKWAGVSILDTSANGRDLWLYEIARGLRTRITHDRGHDRSLLWSPDGQRMLFSSAREGRENLYWSAADRPDRPEVLLADGTDKFPLDWSDDGRYILFVVNRGASPTKSSDIWVLPLFDQRRPYALLDSRFDESSAQLSPDGRWIAYTSNESGADEVYVTSFPTLGVRVRVSVDGGYWPRWRKDGAEIFFRATPPRQSIMTAPFSVRDGKVEIGRENSLFTVRSRGNQRYMFDVSADGNRFLVNVTPDLNPADPLTLMINWRALLQQ
jgi:Tol biopolymer transport system component